jgi:nucleoside-diphosphate-sugar epimerase
MKKNVLVTGSTGFIGTCFVENNKIFNISEVDLITISVDKIDFSKITTVLHLAGLVHQMKGAADDQYFKVNRDLAFEVAKVAKANKVEQFVLMSTAKVFGELTTEKHEWNENSECNPQDTYGKSKYEAEQLVKGLEDKSFKVAIVRSPLVYGPGVKANMLNLVKLVDRFPVLPFGGINNLRSMVYVGNLVALLNHIIENQVSGIYIAGDRSPISTMDLAELISKALGKKRILIQFPKFVLNIANWFKPTYVYRLFGSIVLDNSSTNEILGFVPPFSSEEGILDMVNWYKSGKNKA